MTIEPQFKTAIFQIGHAIGFSAEIYPGRHQRRGESRVTGGGAEEVDLLTRRMYSTFQYRWEKFRQPGAAGKNENLRPNPGTAARDYFVQSARSRGRERGFDPIIAA